MLKIIGMGLSGPGSMTTDGMSALKECDIAYYDSYTSILPENTIREISAAAGKEIIPATRDMLEDSGDLLSKCSSVNVCILVPGDPLSATTHFELAHEAMSRGIDVQIMPNASIILYALVRKLLLKKFPYSLVDKGIGVYGLIDGFSLR